MRWNRMNNMGDEIGELKKEMCENLGSEDWRGREKMSGGKCTEEMVRLKTRLKWSIR